MKKHLLLVFSFLHFSLIALSQNVGIGTPNPAQKLDVNGNVQFSGALMPSGNAGTAGQSLLSNGSGTAPYWGTATSGQQSTTTYSTATVTVSYSNSYTLVPGLTQAVTVPSTGTFDLWIYTDGGAQWTAANANQGAQLEISVWMDGAAIRYSTIMVDNLSNLVNGIRNWSNGMSISNIPAGNHTFEVYVRHRTSGEPAINVAAANVVGNYLIASLTCGLIRK